MARLIAQKAENEAGKWPVNSKESVALRTVAYKGNTAKSEIALFDCVAHTYERTCRNPAMIPAWGELIEAIVGGEEDE